MVPCHLKPCPTCFIDIQWTDTSLVRRPATGQSVHQDRPCKTSLSLFCANCLELVAWDNNQHCLHLNLGLRPKRESQSFDDTHPNRQPLTTVLTLSRLPTISSLKITDRSFSYEAVTFPGNSSSVDLRHGCLSVLMCRWRVWEFFIEDALYKFTFWLIDWLIRYASPRLWNQLPDSFR